MQAETLPVGRWRRRPSCSWLLPIRNNESQSNEELRHVHHQTGQIRQPKRGDEVGKEEGVEVHKFGEEAECAGSGGDEDGELHEGDHVLVPFAACESHDDCCLET